MEDSQPAVELREALLAAIGAGVTEPWSDDSFAGMALRIFAHHYARNVPYRRFCDSQRVSASRVEHWTQIPALPVAAFKTADVCAFPPAEAGVVYLTSGTTDQAAQGRHYLRDTRLYDAALVPNLKAHLLADADSMRIAVLAPSATEAPHSSLSHMLALAVERWGAPGSRFYVTRGQLDFRALDADLTALEAYGEPVCLMGTAFAFVHFLDDAAVRGRRYRLADGSRLMDTGGFKARSREIPRDELYRQYERCFGIPTHHVVNEYGMTEMSSQFYDTVLADFRAGRRRERRKVAPPWVRTMVVDPESLSPLLPGELGLLRHYDLANLDSVLALQTEDLGVGLEEGFQVLGRAAGAEPRGCSLAADELVSRGRPAAGR
jgi:hypothetical protein